MEVRARMIYKVRFFNIIQNLIINSRIIFPAIAGSISASAFIVSQPFFLVIGLSFFILSLQNKTIKVSDRVGLSYGLAYSLVGVSWFFVVDEQYQATSHTVLLGFELLAILLMSIPFAVVGVFVTLFSIKSRQSIFWFITIVAPSLTLLEWVKTWLLTGFPWFQVSHLFSGTFFKGWFAIFGDIGVSFLFYLLVSSLCYVIVNPNKSKNIPLLSMAISVFILATLVVSNIEYTSVEKGKTLNVQIINDTASLEEDSTYEGRINRIKKYQKIALDADEVDISVWPETSTGAGVFSDIQYDVSDGFSQLKQKGVKIYFGSYRREGLYVKNSIFSSFSEDEVYTKQHLIPVGEYIPNWFALFDMWIPGTFQSSTISDLSLNKALTHNGIDIAPMICYEVLFSNELRKRSNNAGILIVVSNLKALKPKWAKNYFFNLSKIRAMEFQKPLIQSTNSGFSGVISSNGKVIKKQSTSLAVILENIQSRRGNTPFAKYGYSVIILICILLLLVGTWRAIKMA